MPIKKLPKHMEKQKFDLFLSEPRITPVSEMKHHTDTSTDSSNFHKNVSLATELIENIENVRIYIKIVKGLPNVKNEVSILFTLTTIQEFCHTASKLISSFSSPSIRPDVILFNYLSKPFDLICDTIYAILQILNKNKTKKISSLYKVVYNKAPFEHYIKDLALLGKFSTFGKYLLYKQNKSFHLEKNLNAIIDGDSLSTKLIPLLYKQELLNSTSNVISSDSHQEAGTSIILQTKEDLYKEKKKSFGEIEALKREVINHYRTLINSGDPEGYRRIGNFIYKHSTDKTTDIAKYWLFLASENFEDETVYYNLGRIYEKESSLGNKEVLAISIAYFRKAAQLGLTKSYNRLGQIYEFNFKDEHKAREYYKEGVGRDDVFCMNNLARSILSSITINSTNNINNNKNNVDKNREKKDGERFYKDKGLFERHETRHDFYTNKESVLDCKKHQKFEFCIPSLFNQEQQIKIKHALDLFKKACSLKNEHAFINLGIIYEDGDFVEKDLILAMRFYLEAEKIISIKIKQKHKETKHLEIVNYLIGKIYYKLGDFESAFLFFSKVKNRGKYGHFGSNTDIYLGLLFEMGQFVQVNRNRARTHYLWACGKNNNNLKALYKLGELNYNEQFEGLKKKGKEQLIECANKGMVEAIIKVATFYEAEEDYEKAKEYYERINGDEGILNVEKQIKRLSKIENKSIDNRKHKEKESNGVNVEKVNVDNKCSGLEENERAIERIFHESKNDGLKISNDILSYFVEDHS